MVNTKFQSRGRGRGRRGEEEERGVEKRIWEKRWGQEERKEEKSNSKRKEEVKNIPKQTFPEWQLPEETHFLPHHSQRLEVDRHLEQLKSRHCFSSKGKKKERISRFHIIMVLSQSHVYPRIAALYHEVSFYDFHSTLINNILSCLQQQLFISFFKPSWTIIFSTMTDTDTH